MARTLSLDVSVLGTFRDLLRGSLGLGSYLVDRLDDGELSVWVPEGVTVVEPKRLREDVFYPESFDIEEVRKETIRRFLNTEPDGLVIADTAYRPTDPTPDYFREIETFSLAPMYDPGQRRLCVFARGPQLSEAAYDALLRAASPYPTTLTVTSLREGAGLSPGVHLNAQSEVLQAIINRTKGLMVGVFDESSMMVWSKG